MDEAEVLDVLKRVGAFRAGHFVFTSGLHASTYINKDAMYPFTREVSRLCKEIASRFKDTGIEAVIAPAVGAIVLGQWTAYHMTEQANKDIFAVYADKDGEGGFVVRRGYDHIIKGKRTLVVEDLTTTGGSVKRVVEAARSVGADVQGAVAIFNRGGVQAKDVGDPPIFMSLVNLQLDQWPEDQCDLCKRGIPVNTDIGHGKDFLKKKGALV